MEIWWPPSHPSQSNVERFGGHQVSKRKVFFFLVCLETWWPRGHHVISCNPTSNNMVATRFSHGKEKKQFGHQVLPCSLTWNDLVATKSLNKKSQPRFKHYFFFSFRLSNKEIQVPNPIFLFLRRFLSFRKRGPNLMFKKNKKMI